MQRTALILAAGEGTRMKSAKPKVAHELLNLPLVRWVVNAVADAGCNEIITVVGHGRKVVMPLVADTHIIVQEEQLGTGHAVLCAKEKLASMTGSLVVVSGDSPLIKPQTIRALIDYREQQQAAVAVLTMEPPSNKGYGRIARDDFGALAAIIEEKDCSPAQRELRECNSGIYCFDVQLLLEQLDKLSTDNAQGEYYLTDVIVICREEGLGAVAYCSSDYTEALGINSRIQLAEATALMQGRINEAHMAAGVTMLDPKLVWIGPEVSIGTDVELLPMTFLSGKTSVGSGSIIGPSCRLRDCTVGEGCFLEGTVAEMVYIGDGTILQQGSTIKENIPAKTITAQ